MSARSTILVVDDEPRNVKLLEALLITQGHTIITAPDGPGALAIAAQQPVDLILLDVMMPDLDGFEVTRRLRQDPRTRLLPIVLVTALRETADRIAGIEAGCDDFISKPFDKHEVLARVKTLLRLNYYRAQLDQHEQFSYVMEHTSDGIVLLDASLRATRVNRRATELLGGLAPGAALLEHLAAGFQVAYDGALAEGLRAGSRTFDIARPETDTVKALTLQAQSTAVTEPGGALSSIVLTLRDVTDQRREAHTKADFLSLISHKLRTPIAVITSHTAMLRDGMLGAMPPEQQEAIAAIQDKAWALSRLIGQLLEFTTFYSQALDRARTPIRLSDYLPKHAEAFAKRPAAKPIQWRVECADPEASVLANPAYLDLMLDNLLDNAVKFTDQPPAQVQLSARRDGALVAIAVQDRGRGIPPEDRAQIFQPFYQVEKYFTGNVDGAGLGLALVHRLAKAQGGSVDVDSALGRGSTFTVRLPAA
jgi:signal transduction histidine kinase